MSGRTGPKRPREIELERHIRVLRDALENAPHSSAMAEPSYDAWYREQRGPALDSTDPDRWRPIRSA